MKRLPASPPRGPLQALEQWLSTVGAVPAFTALAELGEQAVFVVDAERRSVLWNRRAEELLGFRAEQGSADPCLDAELMAACPGAHALFEQGAVAGASRELIRADGTAVTVRGYAHAFAHSDGSFAGGIEILVPQRERSSQVSVSAALPLGDEETVTFHGLISRDPKMHQAFAVIRNVAETDSTVLGGCPRIHSLEFRTQDIGSCC